MYILFLAVLGLLCCMGLSLVAESRGYFLVIVHRLLITGVSLLAEHGLYGRWPWYSQTLGSRTQAK